MAILGKNASFLGASAFWSLRTIGSQPCSRVCHPWARTNSNDLQPMLCLDLHTHTHIYPYTLIHAYTSSNPVW